jgi:uncharacterized protein
MKAMIIGIISDTHNNVETARMAVNVFRERGVQLVIHAGDLTSAKMLELFREFSCRFVLGNCDIDREAINKSTQELGFGCAETSCDFEVGGKRFFVLHGNDVPAFRKAAASGDYHYIIKGHTHSFENYLQNRTRIINPGATYGERTHTVAILDTEKDEVEQIDLY